MNTMNFSISLATFLIMVVTLVQVSVIAKPKGCLEGHPCFSSGYLKLSNKNISSLTSSGSTHLDNVIVRGSATVSGSSHFENVTVHGSVKNSGSTHFDNVIVQGSLKCCGSLEAERGSFGGLKSSGFVSLVDLVVSGFTVVSGDLVARNTQFEEIKSSSCKSVFTGCTIKSMSVNTMSVCGSSNVVIINNRVIGSGGDDQKKLIELDGSIVLGDITFEGKEGEVILRNGAVVNGKVINGIVISK